MPDAETAIAYRLATLERNAAEHDKRVGRTMEVVAKHEEQISGDRGISKGLAELTRAVRELNELIRSDHDRRSTRVWQFVGVAVAAFIGAFATILAAGIPTP